MDSSEVASLYLARILQKQKVMIARSTKCFLISYLSRFYPSFGSFQLVSRVFHEDVELDICEHELSKLPKDWINRALTQKEIWEKSCKLLWWGHSDYPTCLYNLPNPPPFLFYTGEACWKGAESLSVVGSRDPSRDLLSWMERELSLFVAKNSLVVVSGGARGVDQKAHQLALRHQRATLVLLPSSLDLLYPSSLWDWKDAVMDGGGAFLSEYPPRVGMRKQHFAQRNRLIAALAPCCVILQASRRSGTMLTARWAIELGREIGVLPFAPWDWRGDGSLDLLAEGAHQVRSAADLSVLFERKRGFASYRFS